MLFENLYQAQVTCKKLNNFLTILNKRNFYLNPYQGDLLFSEDKFKKQCREHDKIQKKIYRSYYE